MLSNTYFHKYAEWIQIMKEAILDNGYAVISSSVASPKTFKAKTEEEATQIFVKQKIKNL